VEVTGALAGLRVLDLTRVLAGPWCGMLLGDLGADVIKVESVGMGDDTRSWGPPFVEGESAYFLGCNRNKRSVCVDFGTPEGKALLGHMLAAVDVVLDNFKTGTLARWGFDNAWFEQQAPNTVHCSITGYGEDGPDAQLPGYDFILQAESGLMSICGPQVGAATKYGVAIVDLATGMMAANAIQAALIARFRTGRGQKVEVCLFDTAISLLANVGNSHLATGKEALRYGNGHPTIVPYTTFECADGVIAIAVGNDNQFARLAQLLGQPDWAHDPRFVTNSERVLNRQEIEQKVAAATAHWLVDELIGAMRSAGIPCGRVQSVAQALSSPHTLARQMVLMSQRSDGHAVKTLASPMKMMGTPLQSSWRLPPRLAQHTREVLVEVFGLSEQHVQALMTAGVVA
jgi:crotonobetainyl-CoA:carnitine CoA-transferase CaiB-like acyl-CoA transferase